MGKTSPLLIGSRTTYPLNPWVSWCYQFNSKLGKEDETTFNARLTQYVRSYKELITATFPYEAFKDYKLKCGFKSIIVPGKIYEYNFTASLIPPAPPPPPPAAKSSQVKAVSKPLQVIHVLSLGLSLPQTFVTAQPDDGSNGSGNPPPPKKPGS